MKAIIIILILVLAISGAYALEFNTCGSEPGHYSDAEGNNYCFSEQLIFDYLKITNGICLSEGG